MHLTRQTRTVAQNGCTLTSASPVRLYSLCALKREPAFVLMLLLVIKVVIT
jgi:hypothetical protein